MKVLMRLFVKVLLLILVIAGAGGGACAWQAYRQSAPEAVVDRYLMCLIENDAENAYKLLDQSESTAMSSEEYAGALEAQDYILYSGYKIREGVVRRDSSANEYVDYHVEFLNAADEVKQEEEFTVKKQEDSILGIFDCWRVMAQHCLVQDYKITVPAGAEVYLNNVSADRSWIMSNEAETAYDHYVIPTLIPGDVDITIRHAVLESVSATLDVTDGSQDYSGKMVLKESARNECTEIGVKALKTLFSAAVSNNLEETGELFDSCLETAEHFAREQAEVFAEQLENFRHIAVSDFAVQFSEPVFSEEWNGAVVTEMSFSYRYVVREEVTYESGNYLEDGTPEYITEPVEHADDATAKMTMAFYDNAWHIAAMELPVAMAQSE